jgi:hypothetical protein
MAALGGADHKLAVVTIKSGAEALAERSTAFARYFEGIQRSDNPRYNSCERQSHQQQIVEVGGMRRVLRIV